MGSYCTFFLLLAIFPYVIADFQPLCSHNESVSNQTCFSITIPKRGGSSQTHHFCLPKDALDVRPTTYCRDTSCTEAHPSDFVFKAPWLCCDELSQPNPCRKIKCPLPPSNRKCETYYEESQCCPSYYCGKERIQDHQNYCTTVKCPRRKVPKTCIEFHDPYDCCSQIDCTNVEKKSKCPFLHVDLAIYRPKLVDADAEKLSWDRRNWHFERQRQLLFVWDEKSQSYSEMTEVRRCVGDHTCPNQETCCPASGSLDGRPFSPYPKAFLGFCVPILDPEAQVIKVVVAPPKGEKDQTQYQTSP